MSTASPIEPLPWDTEFFGTPIARVTGDAVREHRFGEACGAAMADGVRCLYLLVPATNVAAVRGAERSGFALTDVRVTLRSGVKTAAASPPGSLAAGVEFRPAVLDDVPALEAIARAAHTDTRFFADARFSRDHARGLYAAWIRNSVTGLADRVDVAVEGGAPLGYVTWKDRGAHGELGLIAVADAARGKGLGASLVARAIAHSAAAGHASLTVVTSGRNLGALRLYERSGFLTDAVELWYHRWLDAPSDPAPRENEP